MLFPAIRILVGSIFALVGFMMALGATIMLGVGFVNLPGTYFSVPTLSLFHGPLFYTGMIAVYFTVLIPSIAIFFAGLRTIQRRRYLSRAVGFSLLAIWFIALAASGITVSRFAMRAEEIMNTSPEYKTVTVDRELMPFTKVVASNGVRIEYVRGDVSRASITASGNNIDTLETLVEGDTLTIERQRELNPCYIFCPNRMITVTLTAPNITNVEVRDASRFEGDITTPGEFVLTTTDASVARISLTASSLLLNISDASSVTITGTVASENITVSDASRYRGQALLSQDVVADISDASRADVSAEKTLKVTARDASSLRYLGSPVIEKTTSDASSVRRLEQAVSDRDYLYE